MNLSSHKEQISYIIGRDLARNFAQQSLDLDIDVLTTSLKEALAGQPSRLTQEQTETAMRQLQEQFAETEPQQETSDVSNNKAEGEAFLAENQNKPGVTTLPSGLQYEVLTEGTGKKPTPRSSVTTHYHGTLINGNVFDSSYQRGQPATFGVNQVIAGWTEALQLMPEGSKWRLYIPSDLAYGKRGAGRDIGPDSALIFDVELLKVNNWSTAPAASTSTAATHPSWVRTTTAEAATSASKAVPAAPPAPSPAPVEVGQAVRREPELSPPLPTLRSEDGRLVLTATTLTVNGNTFGLLELEAIELTPVRWLLWYLLGGLTLAGFALAFLQNWLRTMPAMLGLAAGALLLAYGRRGTNRLRLHRLGREAAHFALPGEPTQWQKLVAETNRRVRRSHDQAAAATAALLPSEPLPISPDSGTFPTSNV